MPQFSYVAGDRERKIPLVTDGSFEFEDGELLAEMAAEDFHTTQDGWECKWPIAFTIYRDDEVLGVFDVELDVEPSFMACRR
jgi:hypothetical protein